MNGATATTPARAIATLLGFLVMACGCSRESATGAPPATQQQPTEQERLAKAAADGAAAGDAMARSIRMRNSRYAVPDTAVRSETKTDDATAGAPVTPKPRMTADGYRELDWLDIIPKADVEALEHPAKPIVIRHIGNKRGAQYGTYHVVEGIDGQKAQLSGYVVPLESDDQGNMTSFFFVPFYGACIHVPPPPPNQIIYAKLDRGVKTPNIWDPFWLKGTLRAHTVSNAVAGAAYTMDQVQLVPWNGDIPP